MTSSRSRTRDFQLDSSETHRCRGMSLPFWSTLWSPRVVSARSPSISAATMAARFTATTTLLAAVVSCGVVGVVSPCYVYPAGQRDPCVDRQCSFGAQCVPSLDGMTSRCQCPARCDDYGDSVGSGPLCADDGRDYANECEMTRSACRDLRDVRRKFEGKCDPCDGFRCPATMTCQLDAQRRPVCRCADHCDDPVQRLPMTTMMTLSPVCGTDGQTYRNECKIRVHSCKVRRDIGIAHAGFCSLGNMTCGGGTLRCDWNSGEECIEGAGSGPPRCQCPTCDQTVVPVCGTDNRTYENVCELLRQSCVSRNPKLVVAYGGQCDTQSPCQGFVCSFGSTCFIRTGRPVCQCPTACLDHYQPVCGSDGRSYDNECRMTMANCAEQKSITVRNKGLCSGCESKKCDFYSICDSDPVNGARCVCPAMCIHVENPVCGTDGETYMNECELQVRSCRKQQLVVVSSKGPCDKCFRVRCRVPGEVCRNGRCRCATQRCSSGGKVCASDGRTYSSECALNRTACLTGQTTLRVVHAGECDDVSASSGDACDETNCKYGGTCVQDAEGIRGCTCQFDCHSSDSTDHVCGSDGVVYSNACRLRLHACNTQTDLFITSLDNCPSKGVETYNSDVSDGDGPSACDGGSSELVNPETGHPFDCNHEACPTGSFCRHSLDGSVYDTARCCNSDTSVKKCSGTKYGCCPDGETPSTSADQSGCPNGCNCNPVGSYGQHCHRRTRQCTCRPGVGGLKCDRCEPNYWGLPRIADGNSGCIPCGCNLFGSVREDCEQTSGRCVCKPQVSGHKCDVCNNGKVLGPNGCIDNPTVDDCSVVVCQYGAICQMTDGVAQCICPSTCTSGETAAASSNDQGHYDGGTTATSPATPSGPVCGTDGRTYRSACQLRLLVCRMQRDVSVENYGPCRETSSGVNASLSSPDVKRRPSTLAPLFNGKSFIVLHNWDEQRGGNGQELNVDIEFRPSTTSGILLYGAQQDDGRGDFLSLTLNNGFVEFRYDLGSGLIVITSPERVSIGRVQRVLASRVGRHGSLRVNGGAESFGSSPGSLRSLNIEQPFHVGHIANAPESVFKNVGTATGFSGCIYSVKLFAGFATYDFNLDISGASLDVIKHSGIGECGNYPCDSLPCFNNGTCIHEDSYSFQCLCNDGFSGSRCQDKVLFEAPCSRHQCEGASTCYGMSNEKFYCSCPPGRSGELCEIVSGEAPKSTELPEFHGDSYQEVKLFKNAGKAFKYEIWFLATKPNGVLLYGSQDGTTRGDFLSVNLVNQHVQLRFNLGSGPANITSGAISLFTWNRVTVSRTNRFGQMSLNGAKPVSGQSGGQLTELNLPSIIYLGGYPGSRYNPESGITSGFHGAIQRFYEDGVLTGPSASIAAAASAPSPISAPLSDSDLWLPMPGHRLTQYNGPPCASYHNPCVNGRCLRELGDFECECPPHYTGKRCEIPILHIDMTRPLAFNGSIYQRYKNNISKIEKSQTSNRFELKFKTNADQGLLLLQHQSGTTDSDYLAMAINEGHVEVALNLGKEKSSEPLVIRSNVQVTDYRWHTATLTRDGRFVQLAVDGTKPVTVLCVSGATHLDTDGHLWLGGSTATPRGLTSESYYVGFSGCLASLTVNGQTVDLIADRNRHNTVEFCDRRPT